MKSASRLHRFRHLSLAALAAMTALLTACGGGNSDNDAVLIGGKANTSTSTSTTGTATKVTYSATLPTFAAPLTLGAGASLSVPIGTKVKMPSAPYNEITLQYGSPSALTVPVGSQLYQPTSVYGTTTVTLTAATGATNLQAQLFNYTTVTTGVANAPADARENDGRIVVEPSGTLLVAGGGAVNRINPTDSTGTVLVEANAPFDWHGLALDSSGTLYGSGTMPALAPNVYGATLAQRTASGAINAVLTNWDKSATDSTIGKSSIAVDASGNVFYADKTKHRIVKLNASGMTVYAGTGTAGFIDSTSATVAAFNAPSGIAVDKAGNVFVADTGNNAIRLITTTGTVLTVARVKAPITLALAPDMSVYTIAENVLTRISFDYSRVTTLPPPDAFKGTLYHLGISEKGQMFATFWYELNKYDLVRFDPP